MIADLVRFGAPDEIAVEARPHVGSNRLPQVLAGLREHMATLGVEHRFGAVSRARARTVDAFRAVTLVGGDELPADLVVLAVGHSARPVYDWAARAGVAVERKSIAVGVRIEHPQRLIDELQYGAAAGHPEVAGRPLRVDGAGLRARSPNKPPMVQGTPGWSTVVVPVSRSLTWTPAETLVATVSAP